MAAITGPIYTLPGSRHKVPKGTMCDEHPYVPAEVRVQGETDSFGSEMMDLCSSCWEERFPEDFEESKCDWCNRPRSNLKPTRDPDEGSSGQVYLVCITCRSKGIRGVE